MSGVDILHTDGWSQHITQTKLTIRKEITTKFVKKIYHIKNISYKSYRAYTGWKPGSGKILSSSPKRPDRLCGPPSLTFSGYKGPLPRVIRPGLEADHSPPPTFVVENEWSYTSILLCALEAWIKTTLTSFFLL